MILAFIRGGPLEKQASVTAPCPRFRTKSAGKATVRRRVCPIVHIFAKAFTRGWMQASFWREPHSHTRISMLLVVVQKQISEEAHPTYERPDGFPRNLKWCHLHAKNPFHLHCFGSSSARVWKAIGQEVNERRQTVFVDIDVQLLNIAMSQCRIDR